MWAEIDGAVLTFYANSNRTGIRVGSIDLRKECTDARRSTCPTASPIEIEIETAQRTHRMQCADTASVETWITAIRTVMSGQSSKRPPRAARRAASQKTTKRSGGKAPKHPWTPAEDEMLIALIKECGPNHWAQIASRIPGRVGKQCRERWQNHLNPDVNRAAEWSEEEEAALFKWHEVLGNKWADIAKHLPGRTDNSVKNYFHKRVGQLKRGAPAARPKKAIDKRKSVDNGRQALAALVSLHAQRPLSILPRLACNEILMLRARHRNVKPAD